MRIRTKTIVTFLIISLLPLAIIGTIAYQSGKETIKKSLGVNLQQIAYEAIDKVDRSLYAVYHDVQTWAGLELMQEVVTGDVDGKVSSFLMGLSKEYGYYSSISALNREGVVVASSNPELIGKDFKQEDSSFKNTLDGRSHIEDVHFDEIDQTWAVTFYFPIKAKFEEGEVIGVLCARRKADELFGTLQSGAEQSEHSYNRLLLMRGDGLVISAPESKKKDIFKLNLLQIGLKSALLATQKKEGYLVGADEHGQPSLIGYDYSKGYREFPGLGWTALVIQDADTAFAPIERLKIVTLGVGALVTSLVILISLIVSLRMTHSILNLSQVANRVAQGDFEGKIEHASGDEIGSLVQDFNKMVEDLKTQRAQLVDKAYVDSIVSNMINSLIVVDPDGTINTVNKATLDLLGYIEGELIGQPLGVVFADESAFRETWFGSLIGGGSTHNMETTYLSKDGKKIPVLFSGSVMRDNGEIQGIICVAQDITERKRVEEHLHYLAHHDGLTNLPNRTLCMDRLNQALTRAPWHKRVVAVLFLDLDHFKRINDTLGHNVGDLLLKAVAERLTTCLRVGDTVARLSGDEFTLILADVAQPQDVPKVAQKILDAISQPFVIKGQELFITTSIGISLYPDDGEDAETLLKHADTAMYLAKQQGRDNYKHYSPAMDGRTAERLALESSLHKALEREEFLLHYQPRVNLKTGNITGVEALVRWQSPDRGMISPAQFIPLAEETGLIVPIGEWVLRTACVQNVAWQVAGFVPIRVAVNLSARQFQQQNLVETVARVLKETGLDPNYLEIEITESILMQKEEAIIATLTGLRRMGIQISIDDFGTGYSSLSYLKRFPINTLKIDQSFVRDMTTDLGDAAIVRAIVTLAHSLRLRVIAEAVETEEQLRLLRLAECDEMQGYLFSKPLPASEFIELLRQARHLAVGKGP